MLVPIIFTDHERQISETKSQSPYLKLKVGEKRHKGGGSLYSSMTRRKQITKSLMYLHPG